MGSDSQTSTPGSPSLLWASVNKYVETLRALRDPVGLRSYRSLVHSSWAVEEAYILALKSAGLRHDHAIAHGTMKFMEIAGRMEYGLSFENGQWCATLGWPRRETARFPCDVSPVSVYMAVGTAVWAMLDWDILQAERKIADAKKA